MKIGTRVKYIHVDTEDDKETGFYPPIGTLGIVMDIDRTGIRVKWDSGTKHEGIWWCAYEDVEEVEDLNNMNHKSFEYLKELIQKRYGTLDDERGAYLNGTWLSIKAVVELIDEADKRY